MIQYEETKCDYCPYGHSPDLEPRTKVCIKYRMVCELAVKYCPEPEPAQDYLDD